MARTALLSVGLLALVGQAHAFAPVDDGTTGIEGERILRADGHTQALLAHRPAWRSFLAGEGAGWQARFDQKLGTPHRMWGAPIDLGPANTADQVTDGLIAFVDRHADLLGADRTRVRPRSANYVDDTDTWYVELDVLASGMTIQGAGITARIRHGGLVMLGAETYPGLDVPGTRRMARSAALERALALGPAPHAKHLDARADLVVLPVERDGLVTLRPAWRARSRTEFPKGHWDTWIDASSGDLIGSRNDVRFATGTIYAEHDVRTVNGETTVSPLPFLNIDGGAQHLMADSSGSFEADGAWTASLASPYFRILNDAGPEAALAGTGALDITLGDADATMAERDAYVFLHRVRDWAERVAPGVVDEQLTAHVNIDDSCNAYFDGDLNFFTSGRGCNNTGRIADVLFHEWGHGFHYYSLQAGTFDGSLSEGAADVVAFLQTGDHVIAPHFMTNGQGIRDVAPDRVYPDDYNPSDVHSSGLIFGGAIWDLWGLMIDEHGVDEGTALTEQIFADLLKGGPDIASSFDEAFLADDDDGDLSNGTPNECLVLEAFGRHGLGPLGRGTTFLAVHEPITDGSLDLTVDLVPASEACFRFDPQEARVVFRVDQGSWETSDLTLRDRVAEGTLPEIRPGSFVEYYFEIEDGDGEVTTAPLGGPIAPYTLYSDAVVPVHCNDFETNDGGYSHTLVSGTESEGADDWTWGAPRGMGGDPELAASGDRVWGNDLGGGNFNGEYQNGKFNRLSTPLIQTGHYEGVFLQYDRWLTVEDATYDQARVKVNGEVVWTNWANPETEIDHTQDNQWMSHVIDLGGVADRSETWISWELESDEGLSFGGWTLDNVCLMAPATPNNRLGIGDLVAQGNGDDAITVSFTNPKHAPVEEVVVVRRKGRLPDGPDSGKVVHRDTSPDLGALVELVDDEVGRNGNYYYAAYASDGITWSSFTIEGLNADVASPDGEVGGCGCSSTPAPGALLIFGVPLFGLLGRRRRS